MIYFDHNATTPLDGQVLDRMMPWLRSGFGNASSLHAEGQRARAAVDDARDQIASAVGCLPKEVVFTSGGTEANNLALRGLYAARQPRRRVVIGATEHPSVLDTARDLEARGAELVRIPVDEMGLPRLDALADALTPDTALCSLMWANNETGVLNPIDPIARLCRERQVPLHVDAVQAAGKLRIDLRQTPIDLLSLSAHKLQGPKGVGALVVSRKVPLHATQTGGKQERGRRAGTENVAAIVGFGAAIERAEAHREEAVRHLRGLRDRFEAALLERLPRVRIAGQGVERLASTVCALFEGVSAEELIVALDLEGVCVSAGSACSSGSLDPSHVLLAMGYPDGAARSAVRFSFGPTNTGDEVDRVVALLERLVPRLREEAKRSD